MLISQKSEYAIRALVDIAASNSGSPVNRSEIAERQNIPLPYLTQVLRSLVSGGLLESVRGPAGGYKLNLRPGEISLLDVITMMQGPVSPTSCKGREAVHDCERYQECGLVGVWSRLKTANEEVLGDTTLEDILSRDADSGSAIEGNETGSELNIDEKLDCIGVSCPLPIVKIAETMMNLKPGQVLEVWADDEGAKADIPAWCTGTGNEFIGREEFGNQMKFIVRKAR